MSFASLALSVALALPIGATPEQGALPARELVTIKLVINTNTVAVATRDDPMLWVTLLGVGTPETVDPRKPDFLVGKPDPLWLASWLHPGAKALMERRGESASGRPIVFLYRLEDGYCWNAHLAENRLLSWNEFCSHLQDDDVKEARLGPKALLLHQIQRAFLTYSAIEWDSARSYRNLEAEFRMIFSELFTSIGQAERFSAKKPPPSCGGLMFTGHNGPPLLNSEEAAAARSDQEKPLVSDIKQERLEADPQEEDSEPDEGLEQEAIQDETLSYVKDLYLALHTAVWLGRLRYVQSLAHAIGRLDYLFLRMVCIYEGEPDRSPYDFPQRRLDD